MLIMCSFPFARPRHPAHRRGGSVVGGPLAGYSPFTSASGKRTTPSSAAWRGSHPGEPDLNVSRMAERQHRVGLGRQVVAGPDRAIAAPREVRAYDVPGPVVLVRDLQPDLQADLTSGRAIDAGDDP